jgi:hypothetical protein
VVKHEKGAESCLRAKLPLLRHSVGKFFAQSSDYSIAIEATEEAGMFVTG